ncbi:hypothetical protein [Microbacterium oleivorans]|uniref:Lipoprotein n=1 Tax=Microbacterium oleivorans TaxID=273677 RepID=A0A4R5YK22_9MICO|nr:hypothetical protein [Microbacterium oleivorans]TDL45278.1 hypothetical protein E2R54_02095 [Microbacterium oleivorans]
MQASSLRRARSARAAGVFIALGVAALLVSCAPAQPTSGSTLISPAPSAGATQLGVISSVEELREAYVASGGRCEAWVQDNVVTAAEESGTCNDSTVLMYFDSTEAAKASADVLLDITLPGETTSILLGSNWILNSPDASAQQATLGGSVRSTVGETPEPEPAAPAFERQEHTGTGDTVLDIDPFSDIAVVTFTCDSCSRNTTLTSDGDEGLLVNEIGSYTGSHLINIYDNSTTGRFEIEADGKWTLVIDSIDTTPTFAGRAEGKGDSVIFLTGTFASAQIVNNGDSNFQVFAYGNDNNGLVVNEIGAYSGERVLNGPAYVQVISSGAWSISPN